MRRCQTAEVAPVSGRSEVSPLHGWILDVAHKDAPIAVKAMLLDVADQAVMDAVVDVKGHGINEEATALVVQRLVRQRQNDLCHAPDHFAVKDVRYSQHRGLDVADVEPYWEADVVADEQDVFVTVDVNRLIGCCSKGKLSVVR